MPQLPTTNALHAVHRLRQHRLTPLLRRRRAGLLALGLALAGTAHANTYYSNIQLHALDGSMAPGGYAASFQPLARSLAKAGDTGLAGNTAVDLGVLKASAAVPTWIGLPEGPYTYYQATATTGYIDTLRFGQAGGGMIDVQFSFAFDGRVQDPAPANAERASLKLGMTLSGAAGSISTAPTRDLYFRDGLRNPRYDNFFQFAACRTGLPEFGQSPLICAQNREFSFSSSGDKAGTASFSFSVQSGTAIRVATEMLAFVYSDPYTSSAAQYDFAHTALLTAISVPAGTSIVSDLAGNLPSSNGGVSYAPAIAAAVPEPHSSALLLAGLGLLGWVARRRGVRVGHQR